VRGDDAAGDSRRERRHANAMTSEREFLQASAAIPDHQGQFIVVEREFWIVERESWK
jgi:hypothetical protein